MADQLVENFLILRERRKKLHDHLQYCLVKSWDYACEQILLDGDKFDFSRLEQEKYLVEFQRKFLIEWASYENKINESSIDKNFTEITVTVKTYLLTLNKSARVDTALFQRLMPKLINEILEPKK